MFTKILYIEEDMLHPSSSSKEDYGYYVDPEKIEPNYPPIPVFPMDHYKGVIIEDIELERIEYEKDVMRNRIRHPQRRIFLTKKTFEFCAIASLCVLSLVFVLI